MYTYIILYGYDRIKLFKNQRCVVMKSLYLTDLDGTLLNRESTLSKRSSDIINTFIKKGGLFSYATARSFNSSSKVTTGLDIALPVIVYNGGFIYDTIQKKFVHKTIFNKSEILKLIEITRKSGLTPLVYTLINNEEKILWNNSSVLSNGFKYYLSNRVNDKRLTPVDSLEKSFSGDIFYMTFIENYNDLYPVYANIKNDIDFNIVFQQEIYRQEYWCEIMPKTASKANAALKLKNLLDCDELIVFGDSLNDIPMFKIADKSFSVKNANDKLKQISTDVIGYNYDDSVALKLIELEKDKFFD